jgi:uncharacterized protein YndB with AHSA1/START domain
LGDNGSVRVDAASRFIPAFPRVIWRAFSVPGAMERWLPPSNMRGTMLHFDFREGGSYHMRLTYTDLGQAQVKTSEESDEDEVRLTRIDEARMIEQEITFQSDDPAYSGLMRMVWTFQPEATGTLLTVRAENVPAGIRQEDHVAGMNSSLSKLVQFVLGQS